MGMLRLLARFIGYWFVAGAIVMAVVDGAKSIAASALVTTPLAESWAILFAATEETASAAGAPLTLDGPAGTALNWLFAAPTAAVLAALGFLFLLAGAKRRRALFSHELAT
jgi:hypothetical protein